MRTIRLERASVWLGSVGSEKLESCFVSRCTAGAPTQRLVVFYASSQKCSWAALSRDPARETSSRLVPTKTDKYNIPSPGSVSQPRRLCSFHLSDVVPGVFSCCRIGMLVSLEPYILHVKVKGVGDSGFLHSSHDLGSGHHDQIGLPGYQ